MNRKSQVKQPYLFLTDNYYRDLFFDSIFDFWEIFLEMCLHNIVLLDSNNNVTERYVCKMEKQMKKKNGPLKFLVEKALYFLNRRIAKVLVWGDSAI